MVDGKQPVVRNGFFPERTLQTGIGDVEVLRSLRCSGSMSPDTKLGGKVSTINEVLNDKRQRRTFSPEFKMDAASLVLDQGYSIAEAAGSLDIGETALRRWEDSSR